MPAGDGTGPRGEGPMTGRSMGRCTGRASGGYTTSPGRGGGRGFRNRYYETGLTRWERFGQSGIQQDRSDVSRADTLKRQVQSVADTIEQLAVRVNQLLKKKGNS